MTMVMKSRTITASRFKVECLRLLDDVAATGLTLTVTKRGKPVAQIVAVGGPPSLRGSVTFLVDDDELVTPTGERWEALA